MKTDILENIGTQMMGKVVSVVICYAKSFIAIPLIFKYTSHLFIAPSSFFFNAMRLIGVKRTICWQSPLLNVLDFVQLSLLFHRYLLSACHFVFHLPSLW